MSWLDDAYILVRYPTTLLYELSDDSADPSALGSSATLAKDGAVAEVRSYLRRRYPVQCDAQTASALIDELAARIYVYILSTRREGGSMALQGDADSARRTLLAIRDGDQDVPEWEATASSTEIPQGKQEFQHSDDLYDIALDEELIPNEHDEDVR